MKKTYISPVSVSIALGLREGVALVVTSRETAEGSDQLTSEKNERPSEGGSSEWSKPLWAE